MFSFSLFPPYNLEGGEQRGGFGKNFKNPRKYGEQGLATRATFKYFLNIGICPKPRPEKTLENN